MLLSLENVSVCYWRGRRPLWVLRDASMELEAGTVAGVWARSRGGRTTLLEVAAGVRAPDSGHVLIEGRDLAALTARQISALLRDRIGLATREGPALPDLPVGAWVELGLMSLADRRAARARARQVLERVGLGELADEPWHDLSDSERILASIARAIVREPKLLLIDDPAAGLGMIEQVTLLQMLRSFATTTGTGVVITASNLGDLYGVAAIWSLVDGHLVGAAPREADMLEFPRPRRHG